MLRHYAFEHPAMDATLANYPDECAATRELLGMDEIGGLDR
jgi:hypothetical protein